MATIITTHKNMDLDALGAVVGVRKLYPDATVVLPDSKGEEVVRLLTENPDLLEFVEEEKFNQKVGKVIIVDTDSLDRIPKTVKDRISPETEIVVYDHHTSRFDLPAEVHYKETGASTSIIALILKGKGISPSPLEASVMLSGIYADTGSFRYSSTTPLDFLAAAYLLSLGASLEFVKRYIPSELSEVEIDVLKALKDNLKIAEIRGNRIGITYARFDSYVGEVSHLVSRLMDAAALPALFAVIEVQGTTFIIGRSRTPKVDASEVVSRFGGGGHREAASATVKSSTVFDVLERLPNILREVVRPSKLASDVMTSPPIVLNEKATVSEARKILMKNGINAAPVINEKGEIVGIVNRALLDKASYMGMESELLSNVMERDFESVTPNTSIDEVEEIIVSKHQGLVPVVESGKVIGVITRTDLLLNFYGDEINRISGFYKRRLSSSPHFRNVAERLKSALPEEYFSLIRKIGEIADKKGVNAYIVGGFVRDLIIGRKNFDIDVVVEGDATELAKAVVKELGGKVHTFERFKTATVVFPDGKRIDFASARTEVYKAPGALPEVDMAPLKKDLMRRDFTINTLAIKINKNEFGRLIDFFGGLKDIKEKKIRVLHSLSFVEDPTRMLRAIRFATRYRFELGKNTEKLLKMAVERKLFKTVEGQRIYHELKQILLEDNPLRVINRLNDYGILTAIFPGIKWDRAKKDLFERIRKIAIWHKLNFPSSKVNYSIPYFAALFYREPKNKVESWLKKIAIPQKEAQIIKRILNEFKGISSALSQSKRNSQVFSVLEGKPEELLLFLSAEVEDSTREKVLAYMKDWRFIKLAVSGNDIKALGLPPSPVYKKILDKLKYAVIDRKIPPADREKQLEYLKELVNATEGG
ncbi:MAG: CBS domain-containing protein [Desulfurobacteriaceae bacterium]